LLGAAALGDIGKHFPDKDPAYSGISSMVLLKKVADLLAEEHYLVGNIDATIIAQAPKLAPYLADMRENIAGALGIAVSQVNIKATTEEGLGFTGSGEGIAAQAVCLLDSIGDYLRGGGGVEVYAFDETGNRVSTGCGGCSGCVRNSEG